VAGEGVAQVVEAKRRLAASVEAGASDRVGEGGAGDVPLPERRAQSSCEDVADRSPSGRFCRVTSSGRLNPAGTRVWRRTRDLRPARLRQIRLVQLATTENCCCVPRELLEFGAFKIVD
jgi:hypothetical protein